MAVIGTGSIGARHLQVLRRIGDVCPLAISKRSERVKELARQGYSTAGDMGAAAGMGATLCIIATDTGRHVQDGLGAVENGLDVLIEKPLSVDAAEGHRLCERAAEAGRHVFVGCVLRFSELLNTFRQSLNEVGRLHSVRIECQSYLPGWRPERPYKESYSARADEGGVLRDLIHEIDYAGWLFGWPASVQARVRNLGRLGIASDEVADLTWEAADGCLISISLDYLSSPSRRQLRACGERGTLEWDALANTVILTLDGEPPKRVTSAQTHDEMMLAQTRAFINVRQRIYHPLLATGKDGVRALAVCDAARKASKSSCGEKVDYP